MRHLILIQSTTAFLLQSATAFLLRSATAFLLRSATAFYYKMRPFHYKVLQNNVTFKNSTLLNTKKSIKIDLGSSLSKPAVFFFHVYNMNSY